MFIDDLASRLATRVQVTTDCLKVYLEGVEAAFGSEVDYAMLIRLYSGSQEEIPYSRAQSIGCETKIIQGKPDMKHVSRSYVEGQNLTTRNSMRRFPRLTNAFSKKLQIPAYAVAIHYLHYNFCRIDKSLRVTPATEAGVTHHIWALEEVLGTAGV